jgi:hypothetical protein
MVVIARAGRLVPVGLCACQDQRLGLGLGVYFELCASNFEFQSSNFVLRFSSFELWALVFGFRASNFGLRNLNFI